MTMSVNDQTDPLAVMTKDDVKEQLHAPRGNGAVMNVMSIDLEEWFQVTNFEKNIERSSWDQCLSRVEEIMPRLLDIFKEHDVTATFFVLGWLAQRHTRLIRRIHQEGHEIASHGYDHRLVSSLTRAEFREQLKTSKDILQEIIGQRIDGYRAPSYSFQKETPWVIEELIEAGFLYDSSMFPFGRRCCPELCSSREPNLFQHQGKRLVEYPLSIVKLYGMDMPIAGGGYFRLLPYGIVKQGIEKLNRQKKAAFMYFHPWEFDPDQPRVETASWLSKFRHYVNLERNEGKLVRLVKDFRFASFKKIYWNDPEGIYSTAPQI